MSTNTNDLIKDKVEQEYKDLVFDIKYDKEQFKDPMTIGLLLYRLTMERKKTNELFTKILKKLDEQQQRTSTAHMPKIELSEIEQNIINFVKTRKTTDAEEVQKHFGYKGKNAASARLNSLYNQGLLNKKRIGKKVKYWIQE